ncbi:DUF3732 domain-containing protein [Paraburkholderia strydomiana]|uniref:DUF3732 domain-containing protein n=1 Tax=Paraburkholderia strydomiana TaxID=1245417 RepID=UPI0038BA3164
MQFYIEQLLLWPANSEHSVHSLSFELGRINIIHGRSGTGKSSIISIIDYCLGASRCAIPVGVIRDNVSWFGLQVNIKGSSFVIARKTPGNRQTSNEFYFMPFDGLIPQRPSTTHNDVKFKDQFNNLVRLTNLAIGDGERPRQYDGRPSYRDIVAFNFLPQHIVANPNTLFFKADSYDHREKLKKVLPFALGIIDGAYLVKERERNQLQRQLDALRKQQELRRRAMSSWTAEVDRIWLRAVELGMVEPIEDSSAEQKLASLRLLNETYLEGNLEFALKAPDYAYTNNKYKELQDAEEVAQREVDVLRKQIRGFERLSQRALQFSDAVTSERDRIINLDWLKENLQQKARCVVCGSETNQHHTAVNHLEAEMRRIGALSEALFENPIVDKEIDSAKAALIEAQQKLHSARAGRLSLEKVDRAAKDSLSRVFVMMGRLQALLMSFASLRDTDELALQTAELEKQIQEIEGYLAQVDSQHREALVDDGLTGLISKYAKALGLEQRGKVKLDKQELTLSFTKKDDGKKEYLWEVGSGENWMGYHIATFLAIHEYVSHPSRENLPIFNFLVIDQPSQVYFPSAATGANQLDADKAGLAELRRSRDADFLATKRIFEVLSEGLHATGHKCQIIVLEHADDAIWGTVSDTVEVANWKASDAGLIPMSWR